VARLLFLEQRARLRRFGAFAGNPHLAASAPLEVWIIPL